MNAILPSWLRQNIPEVSDCGLVGYNQAEDTFWVEDSNSLITSHNTMADVMKEFGGDDCNLSIDSSVGAMYRVVNNCLVNSEFSEVFVVKNDAFQLNALQQAFSDWQGLYEKVESSDDWRAAYHLIESFPVLWEPVASVPTFLWSQHDGHRFVDHTVVDDSVLLNLYLPSTSSSLNVSEENFERGYLALAKSIIDTFSVEDCSVKDSSLLG